MILLATLYDEETGFTVEIYGEEVGGQVKFTLKVVGDVPGDLNGFFIDIGGDGGDVFQADVKATNMEGTDGFDYAFQVGTPAGNDDDVTEAEVLWDGSFDDLEGAIFGIRAQSVGVDGEGSVKMTGPYDPEEPPPVTDHFPKTDISHIILHLTDGETSRYVKIDNWEDGEYDLDDCLAILQGVADNYEGFELEGVAIWTGAWDGGGNPGYKYFELDNDTDADAGPTLVGGKSFEDLTRPFATGGKKGDGNKLDDTLQFEDFDFSGCECTVSEAESLSA